MNPVALQNIIMVKLMASKKYDKAFLTGCDSTTEWMLEWFMDNYNNNNSLPFIFANFGVSKEKLEWCKTKFHAILDMTKVKEKGWFKKPRSMLYAPAKKTIWIDTDCQILDNIENMFDLLERNKLAMVEDKPWSKRRGELWHNSGVVGFIDKPIILHQWCQEVHDQPTVGDQEVLHSILNPITKITHIKDLPNEYNVMRLQIEHDNYEGKKKIVHWTGGKGKNKIRDMING
jgi:hypothetical protein